MASLPPSSTARVWVDYKTSPVLGVEHTVQMRYSGGDRAAVAPQVRLLDILTALGAANFNSGWKVLRVRSALAGEEFSQVVEPVAGLISFTGTSGAGITNQTNSYQWGFAGRGINGPRRVSLSLFGLISTQFSTALRWVIGAGGTPVVFNNAYNALVAANSPLVAIDGSPVQWYNYINCNTNSYWERRLRIA